MFKCSITVVIIDRRLLGGLVGSINCADRFRFGHDGVSAKVGEADSVLRPLGITISLRMSLILHKNSFVGALLQ